MKFNVGGVDRLLRIAVGLILVVLAATGIVGWWGWLGVIPLLTGLVRFCPLYWLVGINTCPLKTKRQEQSYGRQTLIRNFPFVLSNKLPQKW